MGRTQIEIGVDKPKDLYLSLGEGFFRQKNSKSGKVEG
ncbi:hypothetical protein B4129_0796 [Bacillus safensis]|nr:hypothetical protein B4129_0796 [Bacillus safensis]